MQTKHKLFAFILSSALVLSGCGAQTPTTPGTGGNTPSGSTGFGSSNDFHLAIPDKTEEPSINLTGTAGKTQKVFINQQEQTLDDQGKFTALVDLVPGENVINVKVTNADGSSLYSTGKTIVYEPQDPQPTPPTLQVTFPDPGGYPLQIVQGLTDPNCEIEANGGKFRSDELGNFIASVPLRSGPNIITVTSTNEEGLKSTRQQVVTYTPPPDEQTTPNTPTVNQPTQPTQPANEQLYLNVSLPEGDEGYISQNSITVNGFTNANNLVEVYVNYFDDDEEKSSLIFSGKATNGRFSVKASLAEEENTLIIKATNTKGESQTIERSVYYKVPW